MQRFFVSKYNILLVARNGMVFSTCCVGLRRREVKEIPADLRLTKVRDLFISRHHSLYLIPCILLYMMQATKMNWKELWRTLLKPVNG